MKNKKDNAFTGLYGTKKVFLFTLSQFFKNKSNILSFLIMFLMSVFFVPVISLTTGSAPAEKEVIIEEDRLPDNIYVYNTTPIYLDGTSEVFGESVFKKCPLTLVTDPSSLTLGKRDLLVNYTFSQNESCYRIFVEGSEDSEIDGETISRCQNLFYNCFEFEKYSMTGIDKDTANSLLYSGYFGNVDSLENFKKGETPSFELRFTLQFIYSVAVLMLCTLASSFIIRTVVEEKSSKLVEFLLVSVEPLALLAGKILAIMVCVLIIMALMISGTLISNYISVEYFDLAGVGDILSQMNISLDLYNLGFELIFIVIISIVLSYITFSVISGIAGACCNSMDEMSSASLLAIAPAMIGYMTVPVLTAFESPTADLVVSLMPILSSFYAPSAYLIGSISLPIMILSLVIQAITALLLALFCRRVFSYIIMYKGNKLSLKTLFSIAGKGEVK